MNLNPAFMRLNINSMVNKSPVHIDKYLGAFYNTFDFVPFPNRVFNILRTTKTFTSLQPGSRPNQLSVRR